MFLHQQMQSQYLRDHLLVHQLQLPWTFLFPLFFFVILMAAPAEAGIVGIIDEAAIVISATSFADSSAPQA